VIPATILRGDARRLPLADESVDLIVTSPPYFALRSYQDGGEHYDGQIGSEPTPAEFVDALLEVTRECVRVLKPTGSLFVNLGDKYASGNHPGDDHDPKRRTARLARRAAPGARPKSLLGLPWRYAIRACDELGLILREEVVWAKPNSLPESVSDRCRRSHEQWFHFTREPRYFAAIDYLREPYAPTSVDRIARGFSANPARDAARLTTGYVSEQQYDPNPLGKLPGSVWSIASESLIVPDAVAHARCCGGVKRDGCEDGLDHYAAFPSEWPKRLILGWSPSGVCVECGEGRRPAVDVEQRPYREASSTDRGKRRDTKPGHEANGWNGAGYPQTVGVARIVGEVCGCNEPIASPLGRATGEETWPTGSRPTGDPSKVVGRAGLERPRLADAGVRVISRWEQRHEAEQLRTSPHRAAMEQESGPAFAHWIRTDRAGARPIPEPLRSSWRERGWLEPVPAFVPPPTRPAVVVDVFGGTGTTAMVARALGRHGVSIDLSADYGRLAQWRTNDRDQLGKVLGVRKVEQQPPEQHALF
jgi:DNA modification methylase